MTTQLRALAATAGWRFPFVRQLASRSPVSLIYHGVSRSADRCRLDVRVFEEHVRFLRLHFEMVGPERIESRRTGADRIRVMLTFDDGLRNNAEVVAPILARHGVPAIFFVATRHFKRGRYLWFSYLRALEDHFDEDRLFFRRESLDMSPPHRSTSVARLRELLLSLQPHPSAMYEAIENELPPLEAFVPPAALDDCYAGMSPEQLWELSRNELFTIGGHTVDHPLLGRCDPAVAVTQMVEGKRAIETITARPCALFAYPGNSYDDSVTAGCRQAGFRAAFCEYQRVGFGGCFESPRIGVYYPALPELGFKVRWSGLLRGMHKWKAKEN